MRLETKVSSSKSFRFRNHNIRSRILGGTLNSPEAYTIYATPFGKNAETNNEAERQITEVISKKKSPEILVNY